MTTHAVSNPIHKLLIAIGLISILAGCGGGGGGAKKDSSPDAFTITPITNAAVKTEVTSSPVTVTGFNQNVSVSIAGGTYSISGGAYTNATSTITNGQVVTVKVTTSDKTNTAVTATLTVGDVSGQFTATTVPDVTPDAFSFTAVKDVGAKSVNTSNEITIAGIDIAVPVSITNGEYAINGGTFTSAAGTVSKDQKIKVRATASDKPATGVTAVLTVGGVVGNYKVTTYADSVAPTAQILFPPPVSMTEGNTILVRGSASDEFSAITSVKVNGVTATTTDGFKNWQVSVPLTMATDNTLKVTTEDVLGNKSENEVKVASEVKVKQAALTTSFPDAVNPFRYIWGMAIDKSNGNNRVLVTDESNQIISIDLNTSQRTIFSTVEASCQLRGLALNSVDNHLYAGCYNTKIFEFDLLDPTKVQEHSSSLYVEFISLIWHVSNGASRVVTVNAETGSIVASDQNFANQSILSDASKSIPNNLNPINHSWSGIAYDKDRNRYLVSDYSQQIIFSVNAATGERAIFSSNSVGAGAQFGAVNSVYIAGVAIDDTNHRLLVTEAISGNLFAVDLITGNRTLISSTTSNNPFNPLYESYVVTVVDPNGYAFLSDYTLQGIYAVDLVTGHRVVFNKE